MTDVPRLTVTVQEVIRMTGLSKSKVNRMVRNGELPSVLLGGRRLIRTSDLEKLLEVEPGTAQISA